MTKRNAAIFLLVVLGLAAGAVLVTRFSEKTPDERPRALAVGLRGTHRVTRALSPLQDQRFQKHFLDTPPAPVPSSSAPGSPSNMINQVNTLNNFNRRQNQ